MNPPSSQAPPTKRSGPISADEAAAGGYRWAVLLVGTFGEYGSRHVLRCPSQEVAERRAAFWRGWRPDVTATVCERVGNEWLAAGPRPGPVPPVTGERSAG